MSEKIPSNRQPFVVEIENISTQTPAKFLRKHWQLVSLSISIFTGFIFGLSLRPLEPSTRTIQILLFPGELLLRMLGLIVQPLMVTGIIVGLSACQIKNALKITLRTFLYFLITSFLSSITGCAFMMATKPGTYAVGFSQPTKNFTLPEIDSFMLALDFLRNIIPANLPTAMISREGGLSKENALKWTTDMADMINHRNYCGLHGTAFGEIEDDEAYLHNANFVGLIFFFTAFGLSLPHFNELGLILAKLSSIVYNTLMRLFEPVMWYTPIGIFFLILGGTLETTQLGIPTTFHASGFYLLTVLIAYLIHDFIILPIIFVFATKSNPYPYIARTFGAILTAFGTASGKATLPLLMKVAEEKLDIDTRISRYFLPLATAINLDGTALYESTAAIFVAQTSGIDLNAQQVFKICFLATGTSLCSKVVPQARLLSLGILLNAGNIPHTNVLILGCLEWIFGRFRAAMNITSDLFGLGIMQCLSEKDLEHDRYVDLHADLDAVSQSSGQDNLVSFAIGNLRKASTVHERDQSLNDEPIFKPLLEQPKISRHASF